LKVVISTGAPGVGTPGATAHSQKPRLGAYNSGSVQLLHSASSSTRLLVLIYPSLFFIDPPIAMLYDKRQEIRSTEAVFCIC
jgi:hypothetical protein